MSVTMSASFGLYRVHFHCMSNVLCPHWLVLKTIKPWMGQNEFSISFNVALCAYVLGCDCACVIERYISMPSPYFNHCRLEERVLAVAPSLRDL